MVELKEGDSIEVLEKDGFVRIKGKIVKEEMIGFVSPGKKRAQVRQHVDLILDSGSRVRKILYKYP